MNKTLIFLLCFCCQVVFAQNIKITYKQTFDLDRTNMWPLYLYIDIKDDTSTLILDFDNETFYSKQNNTPQADVYATMDRKIPFDYIFLDLNNKSINIYEDFARKVYKINDVFPEIKWQLINESKEIHNLIVQKAVGTYRGKTWEVWYAPSIPYSFGPWKLNGLPGLILDAKDSEGKIFFQAEKVEYNQICTICEPPTKDVLKEISLKEYLMLQDNFYNNLEADLPRGTTVTYEKKSFLTTETKFEFPIKFLWEKD